MSDLRNKMGKHLRDAQHRAYLAKRYPRQSPEPLPTCLCGFTWNEVPVMWAMQKPDRRGRTEFYCPACIPPGLLDACDGADTV